MDELLLWQTRNIPRRIKIGMLMVLAGMMKGEARKQLGQGRLAIVILLLAVVPDSEAPSLVLCLLKAVKNALKETKEFEHFGKVLEAFLEGM